MTLPPESAEAVLWVGLAAWLLYLGLADRRVGSARLAMALCWTSLPVASAVFVLPEVWPELTAGTAIRLVLWFGMALGLSGVLMWLRHRSDEPRGDDGIEGGGPPEPPEPPWWPDFERDFRRYARRPQNPRQPVA